MLKIVTDRLSDYCGLKGYYRKGRPASRPSDPPSYAVRSTPTPTARTTEENTALHVLRRPPEGLRLGRPRTDVDRTGPSRRTGRDDQS